VRAGRFQPSGALSGGAANRSATTSAASNTTASQPSGPGVGEQGRPFEQWREPEVVLQVKDVDTGHREQHRRREHEHRTHARPPVHRGEQ